MQTQNHDNTIIFTVGNMFHLWAWLSLITFLVMLTHKSDAPVLLGRYSALVSVTLIGLSLATLMGVVLGRSSALQMRLTARLASWQALAWWRWLVYALASIAIVGVIFFFLGNFPAQYAFLRAYLVMSVILWALTLAGALHLSPRWSIGLALGAGLLILAGMALVADVYPPLARTDEAFIFSMARNFIETGSQTPTIYGPAFGDGYYVGWVWYRALGTWLAVFGETLHSARLHMLTLALFISLMLGTTMQRIYGAKVGALTCLLAIATLSQLIYIRFDMFAAVWATLSLLFYAYARDKQSIFWHIAVGFCAGMMLDSSPAGFAIGAGYAVVYGLRYLQRIRQQRQWLWLPFWGLAIGGGLATGLFILSIQPDSLPDAGYGTGLLPSFIAQIASNLAPDRMLEMASQTLRAFWGYQPILSILAVAGIWRIVRRDTLPLQRDWLVMLGVWFVLILVAYPYFPRYYLLFGLPLVVLVAMEAVRHLPVSGIGLLVLWLVVAITHGYINRGSDSLEDVVRVGEQIADIVPADSVIVGAEPYYFGMLAHENFLGGAIEGNMRVFQAITAEQAWDTIQPQALIFSGNWSHEPARTDALEAYMQANAFHRAGCWLADSYGRIELWTAPAIAPVYDGECIVVH